MSDYYEADGACRRCLRSSPCASFLGMIFVLLGAGAFGVGGVYARIFIKESLDENSPIFEYVDYVIYGLAGATALFVIISYIVCALSTGTNAKRINNTRGQTICCMCCNMTLILCIVLGVIIWLIILCFTAYTIISVAFLTNQQITVFNDQQVDMNKAFEEMKGAPPNTGQPSLTGEGTAIDGNRLDLSYYGLLKDRKQLFKDPALFRQRKEKLILCTGSATAGILIMLFGYMIILICAAMNYARLQENRYFDMDCYSDERAPLRQ